MRHFTASNAVRFMGILFGSGAFMLFAAMCVLMVYSPLDGVLTMICFSVLWICTVKCFSLAEAIDTYERDREWWEARDRRRNRRAGQ